MLLAVRRNAITARVAVIRQNNSLLVTAPDPVRTWWAGASERQVVE
ncbi:hypothetical protein [Rhodococcus rhodochrous]|nr:hypothetical protein [Rhodococcus rhodochrous]